MECRRRSTPGQWLWSFNQTQQCLGIRQLSQYNISRGERTDVSRRRYQGAGDRRWCVSVFISFCCCLPDALVLLLSVRLRFQWKVSPVWRRRRPTPATSTTLRLRPPSPAPACPAPPPTPTACPRFATETVGFLNMSLKSGNFLCFTLRGCVTSPQHKKQQSSSQDKRVVMSRPLIAARFNPDLENLLRDFQGWRSSG